MTLSRRQLQALWIYLGFLPIGFLLFAAIGGLSAGLMFVGLWAYLGMIAVSIKVAMVSWQRLREGPLPEVTLAVTGMGAVGEFGNVLREGKESQPQQQLDGEQKATSGSQGDARGKVGPAHGTVNSIVKAPGSKTS